MLATVTRIAVLSAATLMAACAMQSNRPEQPSPPAASGPSGCDAAKASFAAGQTYSEEIAQRAREASGARTVRVLRPGQVITMEYRYDRLNLKLDAADRIESANCG